MKIKISFCLYSFLFSLLTGTALQAQLSADEIIRRSEEKLRGKSSYAEIKMTVVRPSWNREVVLKAWALGNDYSLIYVMAPAREKGVAFLKREKELWNWQPTINRSIKMPPSMMMQSWMGSDLTNDDLVRESSMIVDYNKYLREEENLDGKDTYRIELIPKEDAAVVWGRILVWIDKKDFVQLKAEMYDEDDYLVNTMYGKNIALLGGKILPRIMEVVPSDKEGHKTVMEYIDLKFDVNINTDFFSIQNLKRID